MEDNTLQQLSAKEDLSPIPCIEEQTGGLPEIASDSETSSNSSNIQGKVGSIPSKIIGHPQASLTFQGLPEDNFSFSRDVIGQALPITPQTASTHETSQLFTRVQTTRKTLSELVTGRWGPDMTYELGGDWEEGERILDTQAPKSHYDEHLEIDMDLAKSPRSRSTSPGGNWSQSRYQEVCVVEKTHIQFSPNRGPVQQIEFHQDTLLQIQMVKPPELQETQSSQEFQNTGQVKVVQEGEQEPDMNRTNLINHLQDCSDKLSLAHQESLDIQLRIRNIDDHIVTSADPLKLEQLGKQRQAFLNIMNNNEAKINTLTQEVKELRDKIQTIDAKEFLLVSSPYQSLRDPVERCITESQQAVHDLLASMTPSQPSEDLQSQSQESSPDIYPAKRLKQQEETSTLQQEQRVVSESNTVPRYCLSTSPQERIEDLLQGILGREGTTDNTPIEHPVSTHSSTQSTPLKMTPGKDTPRGPHEVREIRLMEAWTRIKAFPLSEGIDLLVPQDLVKLDLAKFWGFSIAHMALPEAPTIALKKRSKDYMLTLLDQLQPTLMDFLTRKRERTMKFIDSVIYARSLTVNIVDRMVIGRKPRTSLGNYPAWLSEEGLTTLLKNILTSWESQPAVDITDIYDQVGERQTEMSSMMWIEWCQQAIRALEIRTQRLKAETEVQLATPSIKEQRTLVPVKGGEGIQLLSGPETGVTAAPTTTPMANPRRKIVLEISTDDSRRAHHTPQGDTGFQGPPQIGENGESHPQKSTNCVSGREKEDGSGQFHTLQERDYGDSRRTESCSDLSGIESMEASEEEGEEGEEGNSNGREMEAAEGENSSEGDEIEKEEEGKKERAPDSIESRGEAILTKGNVREITGKDGGGLPLKVGDTSLPQSTRLKHDKISVLAQPRFVPPVSSKLQSRPSPEVQALLPSSVFDPVEGSSGTEGQMTMQPLPQRQGAKRKKPPDFLNPRKEAEIPGTGERTEHVQRDTIVTVQDQQGLSSTDKTVREESTLTTEDTSVVTDATSGQGGALRKILQKDKETDEGWMQAGNTKRRTSRGVVKGGVYRPAEMSTSNRFDLLSTSEENVEEEMETIQQGGRTSPTGNGQQSGKGDLEAGKKKKEKETKKGQKKSMYRTMEDMTKEELEQLLEANKKNLEQIRTKRLELGDNPDNLLAGPQENPKDPTQAKRIHLRKKHEFLVSRHSTIQCAIDHLRDQEPEKPEEEPDMEMEMEERKEDPVQEQGRTEMETGEEGETTATEDSAVGEDKVDSSGGGGGQPDIPPNQEQFRRLYQHSLSKKPPDQSELDVAPLESPLLLSRATPPAPQEGVEIMSGIAEEREEDGARP
ncbi:UNVERIFIED_CONTAM: hypothetical protein K2H54_002251 [Gekko kuhli]